MANFFPPQFPSDAPQFEQGRGPLRPSGSPPMPDAEDGDLSQLSAEELRRLAELGVIDDELAMNLLRQRDEQGAAEAAGPEGRQVGGVYVAASPLEHLASGASRAGALYRRSKLAGEQKGLLDKKRKAYETRFDVGFQAEGFPKPFTFGE